MNHDVRYCYLRGNTTVKCRENNGLRVGCVSTQRSMARSVRPVSYEHSNTDRVAEWLLVVCRSFLNNMYRFSQCEASLTVLRSIKATIPDFFGSSKRESCMTDILSTLALLFQGRISQVMPEINLLNYYIFAEWLCITSLQNDCVRRWLPSRLKVTFPENSLLFGPEAFNKIVLSPVTPALQVCAFVLS